ncbi:MAG: hypothetical protein E7310_04650 [Clostridiales bacterium]|nr:hypothetical protein [Clostridiales bacterium]
MKLIINNNGKEIELDGVIRGIKNKFFVEIIVPNDIKLEPIISNIKGEYNFKGKVTLINNSKSSIRVSANNPNESIYVYEVGYLISDYVDEKDILISSMSIYFKELDKFFIEDRFEIDTEKMEKELTITQKYRKEILLDDENLIIEYNRDAGIDYDEAGHILFLNPAKLSISFKKQIKLPRVFEEMSKIEKVLGFVFNRKMNLMETILLDSNGEIHELIVQFQKDYNDIKLDSFFIVDLNSKQLLKDTLKKYYSDNRIAGAINMFYEYIYNDLDNIFEFTSLVNTLELILTDKNYEKKVKKYAVETNEKLKLNNKKMREILEILSEEQGSFLKEFYKFNNVELRDKIKYVLYCLFKLKESKESEKFISKVINTRNYFVHGGKEQNVLQPIEMVGTKYLLKTILYVMIIDICTTESNSHVDALVLSVPTIYDNIINMFSEI